MQVNAQRIKTERQRKAWSQEQLATVSGLGVRTIQRIETSGVASIESTKSIAVSLNIEVSDLLVEKNFAKPASRMRIKPGTAAGVLCATLFSLGAFFVGSLSFADQIMLDIGISLNGGAKQEGSLLTKNGKYAEMHLDEKLKLVVVPTIQDDGRVFLATQVYEYQTDGYVLIEEPKLLIKNNSEAEIRMTMEGGDEVRFQITPHAN